MQIVCVIPVHNFVQGAWSVLRWVRAEYAKFFTDYKIIVVNDNSQEKWLNDFKRMSELENVEVVHTPKDKAGQLAWNLNQANKYETEIIHVIESDAVPVKGSFYKLLTAYKELSSRGEKMASVSPMYTWKGPYCYPTHQHWHTDGLNRPNGRFSIPDCGKIARVGGAGVPFLFSLWNPKAFKMINNKGFRKLVGLDSDFGNHVYEKGFEHFRLLDCNIEHYEQGRKSR